jgi:hypothetical protein
VKNEHFVRYDPDRKADSKQSHTVLDVYPELTKAPDLEKLPHESYKMKIVDDSLYLGLLLLG